MAKKLSKQVLQKNGSKKVGILLPSEVHTVYEQVARDEHITVAQVIARVAIEFVEVETQASRSRRSVLANYKEELGGKSRPAFRSAAKRE